MVEILIWLKYCRFKPTVLTKSYLDGGAISVYLIWFIIDCFKIKANIDEKILPLILGLRPTSTSVPIILIASNGSSGLQLDILLWRQPTMTFTTSMTSRRRHRRHTG